MSAPRCRAGVRGDRWAPVTDVSADVRKLCKAALAEEELRIPVKSTLSQKLTPLAPRTMSALRSKADVVGIGHIRLLGANSGLFERPRGSSPSQIVTSTCKAISLATRGGVFIRKWVAPIRALMVPNGFSTVSRPGA